MDRDSLFGVFAAQLGFARSEQVIAAASAWIADASTPASAGLGSQAPPFALDPPSTNSVQLGGVDKMLAGPAGTLIVGSDNGFVGVWDSASGKLLEHAWIHGAPTHMTVASDKLYAASDVGDYEVLDLAIYGRDYCELMREVWAAAPIVWQRGKPVVAAPDGEHRCAQSR